MNSRFVVSALLAAASLPVIACQTDGNRVLNCGFDQDLANWNTLAGSCAHDVHVGASKAGSAVCQGASITPDSYVLRWHQCATAAVPGSYVFMAQAQRVAGSGVNCSTEVASYRLDNCAETLALDVSHWLPSSGRFAPARPVALGVDAAAASLSIDVACFSTSPFTVLIDDVLGVIDPIFKHGFEFAPPVLVVDATLNYFENQTASVLDPALLVSDVDSVNLVSASVQISANYQNGADVLAFTPVGGISGNFVVASGTFNLSGTSSLANYQTALRSVTYVNNSNNPTTGSRTITWTASDGSVTSAPDTSTVTMTAVNDAPVLAATANLSYTENQAAQNISPAITVTDVDSTILVGATVQITANFDVGKDVLSFTPVGAVTGVFVDDTLLLSGDDSPANYQTALRSVKYANTSENPSGLSRQVTWQVNDGDVTDGLSNTPISSITVTPVNDVPTGVVPAGSPFAITGNVRRSIGAGTLLAGATDPEGNTLTTQLSGVPTNGATVVVNTNGSFSYNPGTGYDGSASFQFVVCDPTPGCSTPVTVGVSISGMIWFIDDSVVAGTGRLTDPMNSVATFQGVNNGTGNNPAANDNIYLYAGTYTGTMTLLAGQRLFGEGMSVTLAAASGITPPAGSDALPTTVLANRPAWTSTGTTLTLGTGNTIRGFNIGNSTTTKISGTSFGTLTVNEIALSGTGKALNLTTGAFSGASALDSLATTSSGTQGVSLSGITAGTLTIGGTTISGATTQGILVGTTAANVSFGNTSVSAATDGVSLQNNSGGTRTFGTLATTGGSGVGFLHGVGGGTTTVTGATTITNPAGTGIDVQNSTTAVSFAGTTVNKGTSAGTGVKLGSNSGNVVFTSLGITTSAGTALSATENTGAVNVTSNSGSISATSGAALDITKTAAPLSSVSMAFANVSSSGTGMGINLVHVAGTITATGGALTNTGTIVSIGTATASSGGTVSLTYPGTITQATSGQAPIVIQNSTGGTRTFSGAVTATAAGVRGISLLTNPGSTMSFTGGINLNTGANAAFAATGGGTVNVCDENPCNPALTGALVNTLTTTTAIALNITNTTIGANFLEFRSISANGSPNGIVLNNTGAGGLKVVGTGATAGSGGTIQNTTTRGASFITARNITLRNMNFTNAATADAVASNTGLSLGTNLVENASIHLETVFAVLFDNLAIAGSAEEGINGHNVSGFSLRNSTLSGLGNSPDEDGLHFYNMLGTCDITNTTITSSGDDNVNIQNNTNLALPAGMTAVTALTISGGSANTGVQGSGYLMGIRGTSNNTVTISGVTSNNNFSGGIVIDTFDTATSVIDIGTSTSTNNNDAISLSSNNGSTKFDIHNNVSFAGTDAGVINILKAAFATTGTLQGFIRNNPINVANGQVGDGISVFNAGAGPLNIAIANNTITYQGTQRAILIQGGQDGAATVNATVTGNNIDMRLDGTGNAVAGMLAQVAVASPSGDASTMCADIGSGSAAARNVFTHTLGGTMAAGDIRMRQRFVTSVTLPGYAGAATDTAAVVAYLAGRNTLVNSPTATVTNDVLGTGYAGSAGCVQPVFP